MNRISPMLLLGLCALTCAAAQDPVPLTAKVTVRGDGILENQGWTYPDGSFKQQITWIRKSLPKEIVYEQGPSREGIVFTWALEAASSEGDRLSMVVSNQTNASEFWAMEKKSGKWETVAVAHLPSLGGVQSLTFNDLFTLQLNRESGQDLLVVTDRLHVPNQPFRVLEVNGKEFKSPWKLAGAPAQKERQNSPPVAIGTVKNPPVTTPPAQSAPITPSTRNISQWKWILAFSLILSTMVGFFVLYRNRLTNK